MDADAWFTSLYFELHRIAETYVFRETPEALIQPADLLHEAYLKLAARPDFKCSSADEFYAAAAATMRRVLIDQSRRRNAVKRGGEYCRMRVEVDELLSSPRTAELSHLETALEELTRRNPLQGRIVELRYFGGMSFVEIAKRLQLSLSHVRAQWDAARSWLRGALKA